jgi:hypothetical protein
VDVSARSTRKEGESMKRIIGAGIAAISYLVVLPLAALAQEGSGSGLGGPEGPVVGGIGGSIGGTGGAAGAGGTAFTGAEIAGLVLFAVALLAVGIAIVALSRRRVET